MRRSITFVAVGLLCAGASRADTLRVFAAASLADAFRQVATAYENAHPSERVELNLAGSQVLRTQIEQGAPADVFASADLEHAEALRRSGLLSAYDVFARNRLVVVVPLHGARVRRLEDLESPGVRIVVAAPEVPAGRYAARVLAGLDPSGRAAANVVSRESNVRSALAKVALGEADAGFVYATDAATSDRVAAIEIPQRQSVVAEYAIGVVSASSAPERARGFVFLVLGAEGQGILRRFGFAR